MFKTALPLRIPTRPVEAFAVEPASFGGGYMVRLVVEGRSEIAVFSDHLALTEYLKILLSGLALAPVVQAAPEAPEPVAKRKGGRPRLTEAEKLANKERRLAQKLNGAHGQTTEQPQEVAEAV